MAEYIEREALLEEFGEEPLIWTDTEAEIQEYYDWVRYRYIVNSQPAADVAPVVRCRECIWCCKNVDPKTLHTSVMCGYKGYNPVQSSCVLYDDFCSRGEREGDADYGPTD